MSAAAAAEAPPAKGKKKLIIIIAVVALVLLGGGGAAVVLMKKKAAAEHEAEEGGAESTPAKAAVKFDPKAVPVFVPLEPFTVNLADRDSERFAQVGITLEVDTQQTGDQIKALMPAIRHNILMALAERTAGDLMGREGKLKLAERVKSESARALGYEVPEEEPAPEATATDEDKPAPKKKKKKATAPVLPVKAVHFSNFIIQ